MGDVCFPAIECLEECALVKHRRIPTLAKVRGAKGRKEVTQGAEGGKEVDGRLLVVSVQNLSTNRCTSNAPRPAVYRREER